MLKSWQAITLWKRVLIGLVIGMLIGVGLHYGLGAERGGDIAVKYLKPWGQAFVKLIKMLIVPLVTTTLISGVISIGNPKRMGSLGVKTFVMYMATTFFAVWLGLFMGTLFQPGSGMGEIINNASGSIETVSGKLKSAASAKQSMSDYLLGIIPSNPVEAMAKGDMLSIIFFSLIIGFGIMLAGDKGKPVAEFFESASEVVLKITLVIMELAPLGVLALMAWVLGEYGLSIVTNMGKFAIALYLACLFQIFVIYGGLIMRTVLRLPIARYLFGITDAMGVAYSTSSSSATLPVTISNAEKNLGIDKAVAGSVLPLGATINMDGTAIYLGMVALFAAQAFGLPLDMGTYMMVALTATLASVGTAGIPSASLFLAVGMLMNVFGIDEGKAVLIVAFIFPFDRLLDMMRTVTNVAGDVAVATAVAKWEGELDEEVFKTKSVV